MSVGEIIYFEKKHQVEEQISAEIRTGRTLVFELWNNSSVVLIVKQLTIMANKSSYAAKKQLKSPNLKSQTKYMLHETLIRSTLTYGSESWSLSKKNENVFRIF